MNVAHHPDESFESAYADGIDEESAKLHLAALRILAERNVFAPTQDEYIRAVEEVADAQHVGAIDPDVVLDAIVRDRLGEDATADDYLRVVGEVEAEHGIRYSREA